jgi:hypothetical protein
VTVTVNLPDDAARRLAAEAARRGITVDELLTEWAARLPAPADTERSRSTPAPESRFSFIGMGRSGRGDLSGRVKELRREVAAEKLDDERRAAEG